MTSYLAGLSAARAALWCYFLWYLVILVRYFDPSPRLWLTSAGLSVIVGVALVINAEGRGASPRPRTEAWQRFRFFLTPLCVSSFAALVKGQGFVLVFSPRWQEVAIGLAACGGFLALIPLARWKARGKRRA